MGTASILSKEEYIVGTAPAESGATAIRVFIVDDHSIVRHGLASYLTVIGDIEAADGAAAVAGITGLISAGQEPDVVLADLVMPGLDGIGMAEAPRLLPQAPRVIVLSSFGDAEHLRAALRAGVSGYVLKSATAETIADAVLAGCVDVAADVEAVPGVVSLLVSWPDIFCWVFSGRTPRSLVLFVGQIRVSVVNRSTSSWRFLQNSSRSRPGCWAVEFARSASRSRVMISRAPRSSRRTRSSCADRYRVRNSALAHFRW